MKTDETRLTAYLLGEVRDAEYCRDIEERLRQDDELQAFANEIRMLEDGLTEAFQRELDKPLFFPDLVRATSKPAKVYEGTLNYPRWLPWLYATAACFALTTCLVVLNKFVPIGEVEPTLPIGWVYSTEVETSELLTGNWANELEYDQMPRWREQPLWWQADGSYPGSGQHFDELVNSDSSYDNTGFGLLSGVPLTNSFLPFSQVEIALNRGRLPHPWDVHVEELVNSFSYEYSAPSTPDEPFAVHLEQAISPWMNGHTLLRVGIQGYEIPWELRPDSNLVFLVDVSGSMDEKGKLPLVREGIRRLIRKLNAHERIAIVTYGGVSEIILPSTMIVNRPRIESALQNLQPGGDTRAHLGVAEAYAIAEEAFIEGGNNQLIVCSDGEFLMGASEASQVNKLISTHANGGISLSAYGFSIDGGVSPRMEALARMGNGQFAYINSLTDTERLFVGQISGTVIPIARDVTVEVDFNPSYVDAYRLIGYEAGSQTALTRSEELPQLRSRIEPTGHAVTALYELIPSDESGDNGSKRSDLPARSFNPDREFDVVTVRVRYQNPDGSEANTIEVPLRNRIVPFEEASNDFRFATAVAGFGQLLRNSRFKGDVSFNWVLSTARNALGHNKGGYRTTFLEMVKQAEAITNIDYSVAEE